MDTKNKKHGGERRVKNAGHCVTVYSPCYGTIEKVLTETTNLRLRVGKVELN